MRKCSTAPKDTQKLLLGASLFTKRSPQRLVARVWLGRFCVPRLQPKKRLLLQSKRHLSPIRVCFKSHKNHVLRENSMFNKAAVGTNSNCYNFTLTTQKEWKPVCHGTSLHNYIKTKQKWIRGWFESVNKPFGFGYYHEP